MISSSQVNTARREDVVEDFQRNPAPTHRLNAYYIQAQ